MKTRKFLRLCSNRWILSALFTLAIGCTVSCAPQHANDAMTTPERSIVYVSIDDDAAKPATPKPVVREKRVSQYDGVLGQTNGGECRKLISDEPIFEDSSAQEAYSKYSSGDSTEAMKMFESLVGKSELSSDDKQKALFVLGLMTSKDPQGSSKAVAMFKQASAIEAPLKRAAADFGIQAGYTASHWQDIVDLTESIRATDLRRTYRAIALVNLGRYDAAIEQFEAIQAYPKNLRLPALDAKARAQAETSLLKESLETYRRIYEIDPKSEQGQLASEAIMAQRDKWPRGFTFPRTSQKIDKSKSEREIAQAHFDAHRSEKAISAFSKLLKADKSRRDTQRVCDDLYAIARSHVKLRAHSKSLPVFKEALDECKKTELHIKILYSAAKAAWNAGENEQALAWYQELVEQYPAHSYADDAYHYQALILSGLKRNDEARAKLQEQIEKYPDGDMAKDAYWLLLSDLYDRAMWKDAVAFVDKNIEHAGESDLYTQGRLSYFQARAYEHLENKPAALQNYLTILDAYPLSYYAMLSLGRLEVIDEEQTKTWLSVYRQETFRPERAFDYCFTSIGREDAFRAASTLFDLGLSDEALSELDTLTDNDDVHISYEAKLARAMILQKLGRYTESARLAASLLRPTQDFLHQAYAAWLLAYPKPWESIVEQHAKGDKRLYYTTYAIMREESYYNPNAESWANARGLMQLMLPTAQSSAADIGLPKPEARDLFKPHVGIPIGMAYIDKLYQILIPHPMFVLPGYNAGQGNVGKWIKRFADQDVDVYVEKIPFKEARHYAKRVGMTLWRYQWLYDDDMPDIFDPALKVSQLSEQKK